MAQVFPPGPAPKVPTSSRFSAVPTHIHTCELSPSQSLQGSRWDNLGHRRPPHPPPHIQLHIHFIPSGKSSSPSAWPGISQQQSQAQQLQQSEAAWTEGRSCQRCWPLLQGERDPHQPGHLAPVAMLAPSTNVLLDYSVLPGAQAAEDTHIHLCLSSQFLP